MGGGRFRGLALAIIVLIMLGAVFYSFFEFPTSPKDVDLDTTGPRIVALSVLAFVFMASLVFGQPKIRDIFRGVVFWGGLLAVLVVGYTFRGDLITGGYRVLGALAPGLAVNQEDGTILVVRDTTGHFHLNADVNGKPVTFLLDTGASAVVLNYEDALSAGFSNNDLNFSMPVSTANGRAVVAPVKIGSIQIGDTRFNDVRAFVAQPDALETSLFGMSALDRLKSWKIAGDKLILTP
ncbi:TIGR02281 family clan AA aspartic protease [Roseibium aggregatum]|uniref:TIGR02281 family clan AA aspartic protease n=1 Tax=Roseibium aggregatum TaxID=187304 RepID=A0A926NWR9_9HYPH|nr:TIGR02281 family clan AA aspartic protease [Roseibium aggregatum]MBD1546734.1 TIGR02281 family clan AA aspartic protease [Roseibium aggregatum]